MQKPSRRSKAEAMEAMEARMLKPSISGDHLELEEAAQRACNSSSSASSNKKLDLNAPLLSVRRLRAADAPSSARIQDAQQAQDHQPHCSSSSSPSLRRVPFFLWEQQQQQQPQRRRGGAGLLPVLTPPPGRLSPAHPAQGLQQDAFLGHEHPPAAAAADELLGCDLDARSDTVLAHTEAPSVAPTCFVSLLDGDGDDDDDYLEGQEQQQQQQQEEEMVSSIDAAARDFILRRFLPAAKAVANELSPAAAVYGRQAGSFVTSDVWKPLTNPSPQRLPSSRSQHETQRQRSQDLLFVGDNEEEEEGEEEEEEEYESSSVVGGNICGFIPLFRLGGTMKIFRSNNGNQNHQQKQQQAQIPVTSKTWRKFEPEQHAQEDEEWIDEDGNDDPSLRRESGNYMACRYTPSRGNLGSPITIASKGFLGTPTDRVWRKTSIKRMYPIDPYETTTTKNSSSSNKNFNKVNYCQDADSDSSESLISLRLDKLSATTTTSRQSSVNEKIFCLDTLNQVREEAAKQRICSSEDLVETTYSVIDERGHPNVVVPSEILRNSADKQQQQLGELMEEAAKILYTSKRSAPPHMKRGAAVLQEVKVTEVEMNTTTTSKKSFEEEEDGNYALPAEMRICWHEEGGDEKPLQAALSLPAPVGPSQSWLTSARRLSSASKPPLGKPLRAKQFDQFSMRAGVH